MSRQELGSTPVDEAMQLSLFDLSRLDSEAEPIDNIERIAQEMLDQVPADQRRLFLLRFYFKVLMQKLSPFSQQEQQQFAVWVAEDVFGTGNS